MKGYYGNMLVPNYTFSNNSYDVISISANSPSPDGFHKKLVEKTIRQSEFKLKC